jgi:nucleotide-binding universal stress UspA family protein
MLNIRAILVAADFSAASEKAFQLARALASDYQARLIVLHVATPPPFVTTGELERVLQRPDGYLAELEGRFREQERQLRLVYAAGSPARVEFRVESGDPAVEILAVSREAACDLIVMGTHGRTGLGPLLMGSVTEQVVRKAACPVLTVKIPLASDLGPADSALRAADDPRATPSCWSAESCPASAQGVPDAYPTSSQPTERHDR